MKKSLIIFTFLLAFSYVDAQENKFATKRASNAISHISSEMDLTEEQAQFIQETLFNKYAGNSLKIKGQGLSEGEKKDIYRAAAAATRKLLRDQFSKEEVLQIIKLERASFKK